MKIYELVIAGGGVTGLTAAFVAARNGLSVLLLEKAVCGGQAAVLESVPGYPGIERADGWEFTQTIAGQAMENKAEIRDSVSVARIGAADRPGGVLKTDSADGAEFFSRAVLVATGGEPKMTGIRGEERFLRQGIHTCAQCAGARYRGKKVAVAGNGEKALNAAVHLLNSACTVTVITEDNALRGPEALRRRLIDSGQCSVFADTRIIGLDGDGYLAALKLEGAGGKGPYPLPVSALFLYLGIVPNSGVIDADRDAEGFVRVGPGFTTSVPGIFAAGDVVRPMPLPVIAAGQGADAASMITTCLGR